MLFLPIIFFCTIAGECAFHTMPATESLQFCNQNLKQRYELFVEEKDKLSRIYATCVPVRKAMEVSL